MASRVLILDDDPAIRFGVGTFLRNHGYVVDEAETVVQAEQLFRTQRPRVVVADYELPDGTALDLLPRLRRIDAQAPVILLTGHSSVDLAVQAIKEGAEHFLTKPVALPALLVVLERALENQRNRQRQLARTSRTTRQAVDPFAGGSAAIRTLADQARRVAAAGRPIWIRGETGTGKGLLARWLHANGPRAAEPLVELNCASLPRELVESELFGHEKGAFTGAVQARAGLLEAAHQGTLFLDEIGDMDLQLQPKLLKVLEDHEFRRVGEVRDRQVDVQLIAATHQDLAAQVQAKQFRADLFFRISTVQLALPALRDRREDIPLLARGLLERIAQEVGRPDLALSAEAMAALASYPWPGNVRELRNVLERAALLTDHAVLERRDLVFDLAGAVGTAGVASTASTAGAAGAAGAAPVASAEGDGDDPLALTLADVERRHIERVLRAEDGHVERAARRLGVSRSSLYQKLKGYGSGEPGPR